MKESKFLALKAAGFTNREIIDAYKEGKLAELLALADDPPCDCMVLGCSGCDGEREEEES